MICKSILILKKQLHQVYLQNPHSYESDFELRLQVFHLSDPMCFFVSSSVSILQIHKILQLQLNHVKEKKRKIKEIMCVNIEHYMIENKINLAWHLWFHYKSSSPWCFLVMLHITLALFKFSRLQCTIVGKTKVTTISYIKLID